MEKDLKIGQKNISKTAGALLEGMKQGLIDSQRALKSYTKAFNKAVQKPDPDPAVIKDLELKIEITKETIAEWQVGIMENE